MFGEFSEQIPRDLEFQVEFLNEFLKEFAKIFLNKFHKVNHGIISEENVGLLSETNIGGISEDIPNMFSGRISGGISEESERKVSVGIFLNFYRNSWKIF